MLFSNDGFILCCWGGRHLVNYTVNGTQVHQALLEFDAATIILSNDGNYAMHAGIEGKISLRDAWTLELLHSFPKYVFIVFKFDFDIRRQAWLDKQF